MVGAARQRPAVGRALLMGGFFRVEFAANGGAPAVEGRHISQGVGPGHGRRGGLARVDVARHCVGLDAVERGSTGDLDFFGGLAASGQLDGGLAAVARGKPRRGERNFALAAEDGEGIVQAHLHPGADLRDDIVGKFERGEGPAVHAGGAQMTDGVHFFWFGKVAAEGRAGDQARHRYRVTAHVQNAAAAQRLREQAAFRVEAGIESKAALHGPHLAHGAVADQVDQLLRLRVAAVHERLHEEDVVPHCRVDHSHGLGLVDGQWFLAEDVFAGGGRLEYPLGVEWVRRGYVHRFHLSICEQLLVRGVALVDLELGAKAVGRVLCPAAHGYQFAALRSGQAPGKGAGDIAQAEDTPFQLGH